VLKYFGIILFIFFKVEGQRSNPDISLSGLFSAAYFSEKDNLNFGGHDPKTTGFNVQNVELTISHTVDPYLTAQANLISFIDEGETVFELEEAFLQTTSLPLSLQIRAGQYFTRVGRVNFQHPHSWDFADQPLIHNRVYGADGLRGPGLQISWLVPVPFYWEFSLGSQQAVGEIAQSFLGDAGEDGIGIGGYTITDRKTEGIEELLFHAKNSFSFDLSEATTILFGGDALAGPNNKGKDNRTHIYNFDFYLKWKPETSRLGYPFLKWQNEFIWRNYEVVPKGTSLDDVGLLSQISYGIRERWVLGLRGEYADVLNGEQDIFRNERTRIGWNITFFPSEFSKIRLQHNVDFTHDIYNKLNSVFLQAEFNIGSHSAHSF